MSREQADPLIAEHDAIACLELASVARGIVVLDQMAKRAATTIVAARTISPGRYLILLSGSVAEIDEAVSAGLDTAREDLVDSIVLRDPAPELRAALASSTVVALEESLAIIETATVAAALLGADRAIKGAGVRLIELRLGSGLSGKGVFTLTGSLPMIEAARDIVGAALGPSRVVRLEVIAQPHPDLPGRLLAAESAWVRGTALS